MNRFKFPLTVNFVVDRQGRIYFDPSSLIKYHEDICLENGLDPNSVYKLDYNPDALSFIDFYGIPQVSNSINMFYRPEPFEVTKTLLDSIESFLKVGIWLNKEVFEHNPWIAKDKDCSHYIGKGEIENENESN